MGWSQRFRISVVVWVGKVLRSPQRVSDFLSMWRVCRGKVAPFGEYVL